jgi:hypothetical protein
MVDEAELQIKEMISLLDQKRIEPINMEHCGHQQSMSVRVDAGTMVQGQMKFALEKASMRPDNLTPICDSARNCISRASSVSIS